MAFYSLLVDQKSLPGIARDRSEVLATFEKELGRKLTLEDPGGVASVYLLDEWFETGPHFVHHHIPVFAV